MKKLLMALAMLVCSLNSWAGSIYFAPSLFMQKITSQLDNVRETYVRMAAGYWDVIDCFYLAGEVFLIPGSYTMYEFNNVRSQSARTTYAYGVSFLPGLLLTETVSVFLRGSYIATRFWGPDVMKNGGEFGVGLQSDLTKNWTLRGEYIFTAYSSLSYLGSPKSDLFGIGLIYKLQ